MWSTILFFPGMIWHEFSHVLACLVTGVRIHKVKWFGVDEAFVQHDQPRASAGLVISLAPFVLGNLLGVFFLSQAHELFGFFDFSALVFLWLGISVVIFSFPSLTDAQNTLHAFLDSYKKKIGGATPLVWRLFWVLTVPFVFVPLFLLLGIFVLFNRFFLLRLGWLLLVLSWVV